MMSDPQQTDPGGSERDTKPTSPLVVFGFLYGQITGAVLTLVFVLHYLSAESGEALCAHWSMNPAGCKALGAVVVVLAFLVSGILGMRTLLQRRKKP
jgi:succinate dehydrogenase/fumarate reductase cytochrome b subunit